MAEEHVTVGTEKEVDFNSLKKTNELLLKLVEAKDAELKLLQKVLNKMDNLQEGLVYINNKLYDLL